MVVCFVDGARVDPSLLGTNDGLNYGRFDAPGLEVHTYEVRIEIEELLPAMAGAFDDLVVEMRTDDRLDVEPSALMRMGYPSLRAAFDHPAELREVIDIFMHRDILVAFAPYTAQSEFIVNSTDEILVDDAGLTLRGRCFRRHWP
jgi:hypothetical protein